MADIKYKLDWVTGTKRLGDRVTEDASRKGIASRPSTDKPEQDDYYTKMYRLMSSYFDSDEEADKVLSSKKPNSDAIKSMTMQEYTEAVKASAGFVSQAREMAGITQSLTEGGGEAGRKPLPEGTTLRPVARPSATTLRDVTDTDEGMLDDEQPLRDLADAMSTKLIKATELEPVAQEETDEAVDDLSDKLTATRSSAGKDTEESTPVTVEARGAGLMSPTSGERFPAYIKEGSAFRTALADQEAESYSTIFGNAEKKKGKFAGTDVTNMSMSEVFDFVKPSGAFNKYNKDMYGKNTTAIGKYQMVGATLRDLRDRGVLKKLGITEGTAFNRETQDKIAMHLAERRVKGKSLEAARKGMRNEWEGFKKLSNSELDTIINEIGR